MDTTIHSALKAKLAARLAENPMLTESDKLQVSVEYTHLLGDEHIDALCTAFKNKYCNGRFYDWEPVRFACHEQDENCVNRRCIVIKTAAHWVFNVLGK